MDNRSLKLATPSPRDTAHPASAEHAFAHMALVRAVEERLLSLFSEGKLFGTTHTCIGQETCAYAVVDALDRSRDLVFSNHRCHGHYLVYSDDAEGLLAEIMGRATGVCGGRGGSQHLCNRGFFSNGVQGGIVPVATGMALAEKMKSSGAVTVVFLGDGTLGEGAIYEAMNIASLWKVPLLFVLEHNQYAQSTPTTTTIAGDVLARASAFGIATDRRKACDPVALRAYMETVVERVRRTGQPFFQVLDTYRLMAHSKGDDDRDPDEIARHREIDPYRELRASLDPERAATIEAEVKARVDAAVAAADAAPFAALTDDEEARLHAPRVTVSLSASALANDRSGREPQTVVQSINAALHELMDGDPHTVVIGEDLLDPYGGAFKVTRGLSTKHPERVRSTPISESAITGIATGLSLRGMRPIAEIMFGDFLALCADQIINHMAKFRWMYDDQVETPVVVRAPVGGRRGYGPTHSQCIEKIFFGVPGLVSVAVSTRHDPGELLKRATADVRPVIFLEQKLLYGKRLKDDAPAGLVAATPDGEREQLYPTACFRPAGGDAADLTIVTYGEMTEVVEDALVRIFDEDEALAEYLVVAQLTPLRLEPILASVRRTGKLLVVEEGTQPWGFGAEVVARVSEELAGKVRCARVGALHLPIPNARPMEDAVLPDVERVVAGARRLLGA